MRYVAPFLLGLLLCGASIAALDLAAPNDAYAQVAPSPEPVQPPPVAPKLGTCFGNTCLSPELALTVTKVFLNGDKKGTFSAGETIGGGYALLFGYDQWWASGPAVHLSVDFAQKGANKVELSLAATLLRYGHLGVSAERVGDFTQWSLFAALAAPLDLLTTGTVQAQARAAARARAQPQS